MGLGTVGDDDISVNASLGVVFDGQGGNDTLSGNSGRDTFVFHAGYGAVTIDESSGVSAQKSELDIAGVGREDIQVIVTGWGSNDLLITDGVAGDSVTLVDSLNSSQSGVAEVRLSNGDVLTREELIKLEEIGSVGADTIAGTGNADYIDGHGGGDVVTGRGGGDTFVFNRGYGSLTIDETSPVGGEPNILQLGADIDFSNVTISTNDLGDIVIDDGTEGDEIVLEGMANASSDDTVDRGVQEVRFASGVTLSAADILNQKSQVSGSASGDDWFNHPNGSPSTRLQSRLIRTLLE